MSSTYELELKSTFSETEKVPDFVESVANRAGLKNELKEKIMLALSEAATNAIVHGNKENNKKLVSIVVDITSNWVEIQVKDEGEGFNPDDLPDPTKDENLLNPGGRGIFLIEEFADKVNYGDEGRLVIMKFKRP